MTEFLKLIFCAHVSHLIQVLKVSALPEYKTFPQLIDSNTHGWWQVTPLGSTTPTQVCVWVKGKRLTFQFESGVLQSVKAPTSGEVTI